MPDGSVRLTFPLVWVQDYGGEKSSGIGVDGHDVLLIPHTPKASPHPTNPTWGVGGWGGGGGARGVGGVGWGIGGGGVLEEYRVHMHIYTHVARMPRIIRIMSCKGRYIE